VAERAADDFETALQKLLLLLSVFEDYLSMNTRNLSIIDYFELVMEFNS
jgi:hypothetical protein